MVIDREAWHAAVHGVTKSRTRLSDWTELFSWYVDFNYLFVIYFDERFKTNLTFPQRAKPLSPCNSLILINPPLSTNLWDLFCHIDIFLYRLGFASRLFHVAGLSKIYNIFSCLMRPVILWYFSPWLLSPNYTDEL